MEMAKRYSFNGMCTKTDSEYSLLDDLTPQK